MVRFILSTWLALIYSTAALCTEITAQNISQLKTGASKARVTALLGAPWRTVQYNDLDRTENEIWEYRGRDEKGEFRLHIEFDAQGLVTLVKKISDPHR
ncbi:MAG TPA: outer membrane protein assembly factor BamE [Steroidobacteraceae bacterium]|jgi:outer membrane protein assembly factor BamE (lipoprotein component of BamABCDE complex)